MLLFLYNRIDVSEVATFLIVIKAVAYDEVVRDFHDSIVDVKVNFQISWFNEK